MLFPGAPRVARDYSLEVEKTFKAAIPLMEYIGFAQDIEI